MARVRLTAGCLTLVLGGCQPESTETGTPGDVTATHQVVGTEQTTPPASAPVAANSGVGETLASSADATAASVPSTAPEASSGLQTESASSVGPDEPSACPRDLVIPEESTARLTIPLEIVSKGAPFEAGVEQTAEDGTNYSVQFFGLFLSAPRLETATGELVTATFVDESDVPLPYGTVLYSSEAPTPTLRLAAPAGSYQAVHLEVGAPSSCLGGVYEAPLNPDSQMYWSWGATFMALRLEGRATTMDGTAAGFTFHLGPLPGAPLVQSDLRVAGSWTFGTETTPAPRLSIDVDKLLFPHPEGQSLAGHAPTADWLILNLVERAVRAAP